MAQAEKSQYSLRLVALLLVRSLSFSLYLSLSLSHLDAVARHDRGGVAEVVELRYLPRKVVGWRRVSAGRHHANVAADGVLQVGGGGHNAAASALEGPEGLGRELEVVADEVGRVPLARHGGGVLEGQLLLQLRGGARAREPVLLHHGLVRAHVHLRVRMGVGGEHVGRRGGVVLVHKLLLVEVLLVLSVVLLVLVLFLEVLWA